MAPVIELVRYQVNNKLNRTEHTRRWNTYIMSQDREMSDSELEIGNNLMGEVTFESSLEI